jgi:hypothetical protein
MSYAKFIKEEAPDKQMKPIGFLHLYYITKQKTFYDKSFLFLNFRMQLRIKNLIGAGRKSLNGG